MVSRFQRREVFAWQRLQRALTAPIVAAMTIVACSIAATLQGIVAHPAEHIIGLICAAAIGGSLAGALVAEGPPAVLALTIGAVSTATSALILVRLARAAARSENVEAAEAIDAWLLPVLALVLVVCAFVAYLGLLLRRRLFQG